jgi:hypothetical protein
MAAIGAIVLFSVTGFKLIHHNLEAASLPNAEFGSRLLLPGSRHAGLWLLTGPGFCDIVATH